MLWTARRRCGQLGGRSRRPRPAQRLADRGGHRTESHRTVTEFPRILTDRGSLMRCSPDTVNDG